MCTLSNKIKFCTCDTEDVEQLKHYWKLYQKVQRNEYLTVLGIAICPTSMRDNNYEQNNITLENRLNELDAFDFETSFNNGDVIEIVIQCGDSHLTTYEYTYKFKNKKWKKFKKTDFELQSKYQAVDSGSIKGAVILNRNE